MTASQMYCVDVEPSRPRTQRLGLERCRGGELRHRAGEGVVAPRPGAAMRIEDLDRQQERPAIDRGSLEILRELDDPFAVQAHARPLGPCARLRRMVDEHGGSSSCDERRERPVLEDVIRRDQDEAVFAGHEGFGGGERDAVAAFPPIGAYRRDAPGGDPIDERRDGLRLEADDDDDPLEPFGEQAAHSPLDEREPAHAHERLRAAVGDGDQPERSSRGKDHADRRPTPRRVVAFTASSSIQQRLGHATPSFRVP